MCDGIQDLPRHGLGAVACGNEPRGAACKRAARAVQRPEQGSHAVDREPRSDGFTAIEDRYAGYDVYDPAGERIGKVDDLFVDEADSPEYIGVKMGFLGTRSTLLPFEVIRNTDDGGRRLEVSIVKDAAKNGPAFDDEEEITSDFEREVHSYYGLEYTDGERGGYGHYHEEDATTNRYAIPEPRHYPRRLGHPGAARPFRGRGNRRGMGSEIRPQPSIR